MVDSVCAN